MQNGSESLAVTMKAQLVPAWLSAEAAGLDLAPHTARTGHISPLGAHQKGRCAAVAHVFLASSLGEAGSVVDPRGPAGVMFFFLLLSVS